MAAFNKEHRRALVSHVDCKDTNNASDLTQTTCTQDLSAYLLPHYNAFFMYLYSNTYKSAVYSRAKFKTNSI